MSADAADWHDRWPAPSTPFGSASHQTSHNTPTWFDGREAVAQFIDGAIFASARPHGVTLRPGWCNGQPAFATYEPGGTGRLAASGLQILQVAEVNGKPLITTLVSYRDPAIAVRCGLPAIIDPAS